MLYVGFLMWVWYIHPSLRSLASIAIRHTYWIPRHMVYSDRWGFGSLKKLGRLGNAGRNRGIEDRLDTWITMDGHQSQNWAVRTEHTDGWIDVVNGRQRRATQERRLWTFQLDVKAVKPRCQVKWYRKFSHWWSMLRNLYRPVFGKTKFISDQTKE